MPHSQENQPTRRHFVQATAALAAAPFFVRTDDKTDDKPAIVGSGAFRYECDHHWGQKPDHIHWFETHGCAVDKSGLVYITHRGGGEKPKSPAEAQDTVAIFEPNGKFVRSFGKEWHSGGHGIDIREENGTEYLYLAMMMPVNLLVKTDLKGEVVWIKEKPAESHKYDSPDARFAPTNVAFAPDGGFYLADGYGSNYIHQYDKNDKYVRTWGGTGDGPGLYKTPHGIWLDDRPGHSPCLVVADRANARLQYCGLDGAYQSENRSVSFPAHFDTQGDTLLVPDLHARITLLDKNNDLITHLGYDADWTKRVLDGFKIRAQPESWIDGRFVHPHDACFDKDGNIYVAEWVATGRLSKLRKLA